MPRKRANKRKTAARAKSVRRLPTVNWNFLSNLCLVAAALVTVYFGTLWLMDRQINSMRIEGPFERVAALQVEAALTPYLDEGFLSADLRTLQRAVAELPWVERASVRRSWPSTLVVAISEQQAVARWRKDGLLNMKGELFVDHTKHIPAELPLLDGPDGSEQRVAARFFALDARLEQRGITAVSLELNERGAWQMDLSSGMQVRFGADAVDARIERFFDALDRTLAPMAGEVEYIDMRYTNGFAIGWKPGSKARLAESGESDSHG
jgi:cell division protein FtsQ